MTTRSFTLRPGLLVSLRTKLSGNVRYRTNTIEGEHITDAGALKARWETERTVKDPAEHKAGTEARSKARYVVSRICADSEFGLLCPEASAKELEAAVAEAREIASAFNKTARLSRLTVNIVTGRVAPDDVEAVRAINSEIRELMDAMERGIKRLDPSAIREAANRARGLGQMLEEGARTKVQIAIDAARSAARQITKAGETASAEVNDLSLKQIGAMRTAFLDFGDEQDVQQAASQGRAVDFEPEDAPPTAPVSPAPVAVALEL